MELGILNKIWVIFLLVLIASFVQATLTDSIPEDYQEENSIGGSEVEEGGEAYKTTEDPDSISNHEKRASPHDEYYPKHKPKHYSKGKGHQESDSKYEESYGNEYQKNEGKYSKPKGKEVRTKVYEAVTFHNFNESYHCGVIPDTNFELYQSHPSGYGDKGVYDVAPFGKFPWTVLITYKNKYTCTGVLIQSQHVLTSSSCVPEYKSLSNYRIRLGDWDILTNYNEYESYRNLEHRICSRYPVGAEEQKSYSYSSKGYKEEELVILRISDRIDYDKHPHIKPICLPSNNYHEQQESYPNKENYEKGDYTKGYNADYKTETNCWVVGWYGSKKTSLNNHPQPSKQGKYETHPEYYQKYYKGYDKSFVQKRAKVKEVKCQEEQESSYNYNNYNKKNKKSYNNNYNRNSVCFVGVDGYDACVADKGAAVFCIIPEQQHSYSGGGGHSDNTYDAGYTKPQEYYATGSSKGNQGYQYGEDDEFEAEVVFPQKYYGPSYGKGPYQKDIKAHPTQPKAPRYRAVLYAIVQKPNKCLKRSLYSIEYSKQQSKPIRAAKVDYQAVRSIISTFWESAEDQTCPAPKAKYRAPRVNYSYNTKHSSYYGNTGSGKSKSKSSYKPLDLSSYWF